MAVIVVGVFLSRNQAESAVRRLRDRGFGPNQVGFAVPVARAVSAGAARGTPEAFSWITARQEITPPGAAPVQIAGLLTDCAGRTGETSLSGLLACLGIAPNHARWYERQVGEGRSLVLVRTDSRADEAEAIVRQAGSIVMPAAADQPGGATTQSLVERVEPGWSVCTADGKVIGQIAAIGPDYLLVHQGRLFPRSLYVPLSAIQGLEPGLVVLNVRSDQLRRQGWEQPPSPPVAPTITSTTFTQVRPGAEVYTSDGQKIGVVQEVSAECLQVLCCTRLFVPPARVKKATTDQVVLNVPRDQLEEYSWRACAIPRPTAYEVGGPGYSGIPPQEHEPGVPESIETPAGE